MLSYKSGRRLLQGCRALSCLAMSSMRMLSKLLESEAGQLSGSHCLVEWQELGNPRSVVEKKRVIKWTAIGDACDVKVTEKSKAVVYKAKLLACGSKSEMTNKLESDCSVAETPPTPGKKKTPLKKPKQAGRQRNAAKQKCQEEAERVTALLLADLEVAPQSPSCDKQNSQAVLEESLLNSSSVSPSPTPLLPEVTTHDLPPRKRQLTDDTLQQSKRRMVSLQDGNTSHDSLKCLSSPPHTMCQPLHASTPSSSRTPPLNSSRTPPHIVKLKEWMDMRFSELTRRIDHLDDTVAELNRALTKKKAKKQLQCNSIVEPPPVKELGQSNLQDDDPLTVCCGQPDGKHVFLKVATEMALAEFDHLSLCLPKNPEKFALKLLSVFFTDEELSVSNCTKADGRKLLDQEVLLGIKLHMDYKYPVSPEEAAKRWKSVLIKNLNTKCRSSRQKLKAKKPTEQGLPDEVEV